MTAHDPARLALFESCRRLAYRVANKYARGVPWLADDLESDALLALWTAAGRFPGEGSFVALARTRLRWACLNRLRYERRRNPQAFRRAAPFVDPEGRAVDPLAGIAAAGPAVGAALEARDELARVPAEVRVLAELRVDGATWGQLGAAEGVTAAAVRQRIERAVRLAGSGG